MELYQLFYEGKTWVRQSVKEGDPIEKVLTIKILITVHATQLTGHCKREGPFGFIVHTSGLLMFPFIISGNGKESRKSVKYPSLVKHKTHYHISNPFLEWENKFVWQTLIYYWHLQLQSWFSAVWGSTTEHLYRCDYTEDTLFKRQLWWKGWWCNPGAGRNSSSRII